LAAPPVAEHTRRRLEALIREDRPEPEWLMEQLSRMRRLDGVAACAEAVRRLANLELSEAEAERLLRGILDHRAALSGRLGRDPGLRVALIDYLHNVERRLQNPTIVEMAQLLETERSAITDLVTGLYNRRYFGSALRREVRRSGRYGLTFSLLMLDLDGFKDVNDRYGHLVGDQVLGRAGTLIRGAVREADIACRYGGDEFAVIVPETDRLGAYTVAQRIRRAVEDGFAGKPVVGREIPMAISGGIASFPKDGTEAAEVVARADETLYQAKRAGRNRMLLYPTERRRSVRYPASPFVKLGIHRPPEAGVREATGINFSRFGALVETDGAYELAERIGLVLGGPSGADRVEGGVVEGLVVRIEPRAPSSERVRIGVAFEQPLPDATLRASVARGAASRRPRGERA
jgi:diguanylate cyclase (GGDEF)-like protein